MKMYDWEQNEGVTDETKREGRDNDYGEKEAVWNRLTRVANY